MSIYGFVVTTTQDTIIAEIDYNPKNNVATVTGLNDLILKYPDRLEPYSYLERLPLSDIHKFYYGHPKTYNIVLPYKNTFINLELVTKGKYTLYQNQSEKWVKYSNVAYLNANNQWVGGIGNTKVLEEVTSLFLITSSDSLIAIKGDKIQRRNLLKPILKEEMSDKKLKRLNTSNFRLIELFKEINRGSQ